jgi:hypothetical protein
MTIGWAEKSSDKFSAGDLVWHNFRKVESWFRAVWHETQSHCHWMTMKAHQQRQIELMENAGVWRSLTLLTLEFQ